MMETCAKCGRNAHTIRFHMIDRKKVIKGIWQCWLPSNAEEIETQCVDCSYRYPDAPIDVCQSELREDAIALLKEQQGLVAVVRCKDCKYSMHFYERFNNDYVCKKNMDKSGKIPEQDLKGHSMDWYCADGKRKTD